MLPQMLYVLDTLLNYYLALVNNGSDNSNNSKLFVFSVCSSDILVGG